MVYWSSVDWRQQLIDACDAAPPPLELPPVTHTRERDLERMREYGRKYYHANRARFKERYANDPEYADRIRSKSRRWSKINRDKANAKNAARRAGTVNNCPRVRALYRVAKWLRKLGHDCHVDHIYPLSKGGTHTFENLRIIPAAENLAKGNKIPPK